MRNIRRVHDTGMLVWGEALAYLCDDNGEHPHEIVIAQGGNGDFYVSVGPKGHRFTEATVRLCTSGGASSRVPGLTAGIGHAYRALWEALGGERCVPVTPLFEAVIAAIGAPKLTAAVSPGVFTENCGCTRVGGGFCEDSELAPCVFHSAVGQALVEAEKRVRALYGATGAGR